MLDEEEYHRVWSYLNKGNGETRREQIFGAFLREYERVTGLRETNPNAVLHHRLAMYGPPCRKCGKPLRMPRAKLCGSCMAPVSFQF